MIFIILFLLLIPAASHANPDETLTQSIQLHTGWNLVSWYIWPSGTAGITEQIQHMIPETGWISDNPGGEVYYYQEEIEYWPLYENIGDVYWNVDWSFYFNMFGPYTWEYENKPEAWPQSEDVEMITSDAWDDHPGQPTTYEYANHWFFLGYAAPGYCKLGSIPVNPHQSTQYGDPDDFDYEGPFHNLIWDPNSTPLPYEVYELKIIKDDDGRAYIPDPDPVNHNDPPIDEIGMLEPGRGYFLGFVHSGTYEFDGWNEWPKWQNDSVDPDPKSNQQNVASSTHFQYNKYTHWSYPVYIDTVDLNECPLEAGDEIGVFDGEMCVGAAVYRGEFPLIVTAWEDDKATPLEVDGYTDGNTMIFKWYDASENAEIEFELPPTTMSKEDDRIAPQHSGFGLGLYARRSFMDGISVVNQLPKEFKISQNYPNPFNASTVFPLELPQRSRVWIDVFDITGRKVWTVSAGVQNAGWPKIHYNASRLSSGVYFYRVTAEGLERDGTYQDVGKMLLLK